jgi:hypothetical protein
MATQTRSPGVRTPGLPVAGVLLGSLEGDAVPHQKGGQPLLAGASNSPWVAMFQMRRSRRLLNIGFTTSQTAWLGGAEGLPRTTSTMAWRDIDGSRYKGKRILVCALTKVVSDGTASSLLAMLALMLCSLFANFQAIWGTRSVSRPNQGWFSPLAKPVWGNWKTILANRDSRAAPSRSPIGAAADVRPAVPAPLPRPVPHHEDGARIWPLRFHREPI